MRFLKTFIPLIVLGLLSFSQVPAQGRNDINPFITDPFLKSVEREKQQPKNKTKRRLIKPSKGGSSVPLNASKIVFDHLKFYFGSIPKGSKVTHNYPVWNLGSDTLTITSIKPG